MTVDDIERPFRTLFQNTCGLGANHEIWMKIDPYYPYSSKDVAQWP